MKLSFLGAAGTVTGSKYLLEQAGRRVLVDCGLFQGYKQLRLRNWAAPPVALKSLDAVILTHAHIDHSGYLPLLAKNGYTGPVYCSSATRDLCEILLPDSAHLQEEEADYANRRGFSKHHPALPLYTRDDATRALALLKTCAFDEEWEPAPGMMARLTPNGHILGSASVLVRWAGRSIAFSGDLGRPNDLVMKPPSPLHEADYLVLESTYGDRRHDSTDPRAELATIINRTVRRRGAVIIPSFAVGRAQTLLYAVHLLKADGRIPDVPVFLNSPMAADATRLFRAHPGEHRLSHEQCEQMAKVATIINSAEESIRLNERRGPMIIISASGMATGGRVLHHLKTFAPDARNTILFAGFQAGGTRGAAMVGGATSIKIFGEYVPVRAEVAMIDSLSAHADYQEIMAWLGAFQEPPRQTFIVHGEPAAADAMRRRIEEELCWKCRVPEHMEQVELA